MRRGAAPPRPCVTPQYARALRNWRAGASAPRARDHDCHCVAPSPGDGASDGLAGAADTPAFEADVCDVLAPTLRPGQIVLLDAARVHISPRSAPIIAARGCELWFLPGSSPDYSSIEYAFARLKRQAAYVGDGVRWMGRRISPARRTAREPGVAGRLPGRGNAQRVVRGSSAARTSG